MKKSLRISLILLAFTGITCISQAQITITSADASALNAVGKVITNHIDSTVLMVDIGSQGQTSWDFSAVNSDTTISMTSVVPSASPYYSTVFPTSNVVLNFAADFEGSFAEVWQHATQNSSEYLVNGQALNATIENFDVVVTEVNTPASVTMKFPLTYNTQWANNYTSTTTMLMAGFPFGTTVTTNTETSVVDAWGSMKMPGGAVVQALRLRRDSRSVSDGVKDRVISYSFITKSGMSVQVTAKDTLEANSGVIQIADGVSWNDISTNVGIDKEKPVPQNSLFQNKPNPSIHDTRIQYSVGEKQFVTLTIYNSLGTEVATLVNEFKTAGSYEVNFDASQLAPGNYYYQLRAGKYTATKKMIIARQR